MKESTLKARYKHSENVIFRIQNSSSVQVVHLNNLKDYFLLERMAGQCWLFFDGHKTVAELISWLKIKHQTIDSQYITKSVLELVQNLEQKNLLEKA